jgi:hypothetical protein
LIRKGELKMSEDVYFYPLICCVSCANVTKEWGWVENPKDGEIYGVCNRCEEQIKREGIKLYYNK